MRILFCVQDLPLPPPDGFRLYLNALTSELNRDHQVRILGFRSAAQIDDASIKVAMRALPAPRRRSPRWVLETSLSLGRGLVLRRPMKVDELARRMRSALKEEIASFRPDVVHVSTGSLAATGRYLEGVPAVLAALDAWHLNVEAWADQARGVRRAILRTEAKRVRRFEASDFSLFERVVVVTDEDKQALQSLAPSLRLDVVPNGVDMEKFAPKGPPNRKAGRILFTGVMSYAPNVAAAEMLVRDILPLVKQSHSEAHAVIIGRRPNARVRALAEVEDVEVTGEVEAMEPWLSSGSVYACPMVSGTGIKNKLLEAMSNGIACVATPLAVQGMEVRHGEDLLVGSSPSEIASHISDLLSDRDRASRVGEAARAYVKEHHSWSRAARSYERIYEEVCSSA
ncbi:MAG: glycosyltransferase family 4 protein [Actinomycetota bacterium]|nr:glycosyltransferase family 4 protein [Actinomycetota bacterium]